MPLIVSSPLFASFLAILHYMGRAPRTATLHLKSGRRDSRQVTMYRRLRICRDGHLDQSEAYDTS